jgi:hypothetical protein
MTLTCEGCGQSYTKKRCEVEKAQRKGLTRSFCTKACFLAWQTAQARPVEVVANPPADLVTDSTIRTETGRRRYYAPEVADLSDGVNRRRACVGCGKVRKSKSVACRECWQKARAETRLTLPCDQCGTEFTLLRAEDEKKKRHGQAARYCSHVCAGRALKSAGLPCMRCGTPTGSTDRRRHFCSQGCRDAVRDERRWGKTKVCPQCARIFPYSSVRQVYCDRICADMAHSDRMVGEGNSHYKDGSSYGLWFRKMRPLIMERDENRCRACEREDEMVPTGRGDHFQFKSALLVHHINHRPQDNWPENLILICGACHMTHHKSPTTPFPWFGSYAERATSYMTSTWKATATSLQTKFSSTTAS